MSGDVVVLENDPLARVATYVRILGRLPRDPAWVLVGGLAVNVRLARVHRATNDVDTVSPDQPRLVEIMVANGADPLSAGKVQFHHPEVEVDVMPSTEGEALPAAADDRMFALVRRWTMQTASVLELFVVDKTGRVVVTTELSVASRAALVALKAVSIPRRRKGSYPEKIGSDIQDLFRLVDGVPVDALVSEFASLDRESRELLASILTTQFSRDHDVRYNVARLRRYADNLDARVISEDDLTLIGELGAALGVVDDLE